MLTIVIIITISIICLVYFFADNLKACYKVQCVNGKEEIFSSDVYIDGAVWVENNRLIYRPFRAAFYMQLKDSVVSFKRIKCDFQ